MALLSLVRAGLAQTDTFDAAPLNAAWSVIPADATRYSLTERPGYLRLKHGNEPIKFLRELPGPRCVIDLRLDYTPLVADDEGGILSFYTDTQKIELLSYYEAVRPGPWIALRLFRNEDVYEGYASSDGSAWTYIGREVVSGLTQAGLILRGASTSSMDAGSWTVVLDRYIQVGNLAVGMSVELVDAAGVVQDTQRCSDIEDRVVFDFMQKPWPFAGSLRLYAANGALVHQSAVGDIWPGDLYWQDAAVEIRRHNAPLPETGITPLGPLENGYIEELFSVVNMESATINNLVIGVEKYASLDGYKWARLALDQLGSPGAYGPDLTILSVPASGVVYFWVRVDREETPVLEGFEDYGFRLVIKS